VRPPRKQRLALTTSIRTSADIKHHPSAYRGDENPNRRAWHRRATLAHPLAATAIVNCLKFG
jgi:hypothetical protein